ncbi:hypothetical protein ACQPZX_14250 [Actinoplanes sp. CA-142083]|uniref:hypothetical protein n=1 Tax=Actinoplanes sp. CA-142083 TaxID=3239903 RepID=UPI003D8FF840
MIILVVGTLGLLGATTWSAWDQPVSRYPVLQRRITGVGLALSVVALIVMIVVGIVTGP